MDFHIFNCKIYFYEKNDIYLVTYHMKTLWLKTARPLVTATYTIHRIQNFREGPINNKPVDEVVIEDLEEEPLTS